VIVLSEAVRLQSDGAVNGERVAEALAKALARRSDDPPSVSMKTSLPRSSAHR
jgi:hypothetical protein